MIMRPGNFTSLVILCLSFGCALSSSRILADEAAHVVTSPSSGEYQIVWLQLDQGGIALDSKKRERIDVSLFLGLRNGKAVVAWFVHPALSGGRVVWLDASTLKLSETQLRGAFQGRTNRHWGDKNIHYFDYSIDAVVGDGEARKPAASAIPERPRGPSPPPNAITGKFSVAFIDDAGERINFDGKLSGHVVTADQTAGDKLAAGSNWPHYYGDGYRLAGPESKSQLIDDLAQARPVWKSEAYIPTAYGSAPDNRYPDRAGRSGNGGGSASPVVVNGRVYQFYYCPRGPVGQSKPYLENFIGQPFIDEALLLAKARQLFPQRSYQQDAVLNHFRTQADEALVCMDAATPGRRSGRRRFRSAATTTRRINIAGTFRWR